jgi:hypothetical protein
MGIYILSKEMQLARPKKESEDRTVTVSVSMPLELKELVKAVGKKNRRSLSGQIAYYVEEGLRRNGIPLDSERDVVDENAQ